MSRMANDVRGRRARRQFSDEFKEGAVRLVLDEGKTVGAVARELDLTASALSVWVEQARAERTKGKSGLVKEEREELVRLRKDLRIVSEERDILKKAAAFFAKQKPVRFRFIAAEKARHTVRILCRCLGVTPSGFYAWRRRPESARSQEDRRLKVLINTSFKEGRGYYGSPRVHDDLIEWKERVSRKRIIRLMQEDGLKARIRKRTRSRPTAITTSRSRTSPDRQFQADAPNSAGSATPASS